MDVKKTGLAFSGGGIRSGALCSGVLRRLLQKKVVIDYLSTVSGGGYTGVSYLDWKYRKQTRDDPAWHKEFFERMREHSNALCDCYRPCSGILEGTANFFLILFWSLGITIIKGFSLLVPIAIIMEFFFGNILRNQFSCFQEKTNITIPGMQHEVVIRRCIPKFGPQMLELFNVYLSLFLVFLISYYLSTLTRRRTPKYFLVLIAQVSIYTLTMIFLPTTIETYSAFTQPWARFFILGVALLAWLCLPSMRDKTSIVLMALIFAYFIKWRVFQTDLFGIQYTHALFWKMVWAAGILLWIHPYIVMIQMYSWHHTAAWKHERTYFSPESRSAALKRLFSCSKEKADQNRTVTMGDLVDVQPSLNCNVTVNNWRKSNALGEQDFEVLTFSPTSIERIDRNEDDPEFCAKGFLKPEDISLSDAMMTSAAVLSYDLGGFDDHTHSFREIRVLLGLGFGNILLAQPGLTKSWMSWVVTFIIQVIFGIVIIGLPLALYYELLKDWDFWVQLGVIAFICSFLLMSIIAVLPTGHGRQGLLDKFVRWCIINIIHVRIMRTIFGVTNVGSVPPPIMSLSDGGHSENLGILPLLKLRLPRIVVVNGGMLLPGEDEATEILNALKLARRKLRCSFTGMNGRDIEEDIRAEFVQKPSGKQPRSYQFKVYYYSVIDNEERLVGEGDILFLMPRHPDHGVKDFENYKWSDCNGEVKLDLDEAAWGRGPGLKRSEAERLSGCCFECCHWKIFNIILNPLMGVFPFQSTFNQMFTPSQFSAYHREGYRMGLESRAAEFLAEAYSDNDDPDSIRPFLKTVSIDETKF